MRISILLALLIAGGTSHLWGPPVWHRVRLLYWQRQCMTFIARPDQIVYDSGPRMSAASSNVLSTAVAPNPNCLSQLVCLLPPGHMFGGPNMFTASPNEPVNGPITFIHQRRSRNGTARLVILGDVLGIFSLYETCAPIGFVGQLPTPRSEGIPAGRPILFDAFGSAGDGFLDIPFRTRIYAGQPDPADESHFTIAYAVNDKKDIIDGHLQDDGTVTLTFRCGASTRPIVLGRSFAFPKTENIPSTPRVIGPFIGGDLIDDAPRRRE